MDKAEEELHKYFLNRKESETQQKEIRNKFTEDISKLQFELKLATKSTKSLEKEVHNFNKRLENALDTIKNLK